MSGFRAKAPIAETESYESSVSDEMPLALKCRHTNFAGDNKYLCLLGTWLFCFLDQYSPGYIQICSLAAIGTLFYLLDVGSDFYMYMKHRRDGNMYWSECTLLLILAPLIFGLGYKLLSKIWDIQFGKICHILFSKIHWGRVLLKLLDFHPIGPVVRYVSIFTRLSQSSFLFCFKG